MSAFVVDSLVLHVYQIYSVFLQHMPQMTACRRFQHGSELPGGLFFTDISHLLIWPQLNPPSSLQCKMSQCDWDTRSAEPI